MNGTSSHAPCSTVSFATLGCKTNQFESASMQEALQQAGYEIIPFEDAADLVIVNTCTVTNATDAQSRNLVRRARRMNPSCKVVVTGCYAQVDPDALTDLPGVSLIIGNEEKRQLLDFLKENHQSAIVKISDIRQAETVCLPPLTSFAGRSRAFVQIQNGCDAFCSYCIIPYARGASRSASAAEIIAQINGLVDTGYREVVLTGIHIGGYGADLQPQLSLKDLVHRIEEETAVHRLRLGSIEPTELTDDLLATIAKSKIICHHLHIPLQSGDNDILKRMKRTYDRDHFRAVIANARKKLPDAAICLDVITGFPGEGENEANNTYDFVASLPITDLHVFPFSKRPGTPAAEMPAQVSSDVSKKRAARLRSLAATKQQHFAEALIGQELEVVVENAAKGNLLKGISRNYLDIRFSGDAKLAGQCVMVRPVRMENNVLVAELIN
jgi:threonylcarbamoyladenosine tRNA methylthiotransferase MtaB